MARDSDYPQDENSYPADPPPTYPPQPYLPQHQQQQQQHSYPPPQNQNGSPIAQQPSGTPMMALSGSVGGNRNLLNRPVNARTGQRGWSYGLFDCGGSCGTCCWAWCCPCLLFGQNSSRLRHLNNQGAPHPGGGDMFNSECCTYNALLWCGCPCFVHMGKRRDTRQRYNIEGGGASDCCTTWCCIPCALTQDSREIGLEEKSLNNGYL